MDSVRAPILVAIFSQECGSDAERVLSRAQTHEAILTVQSLRECRTARTRNHRPQNPSGFCAVKA
jgi:hypothetical protein